MLNLTKSVKSVVRKNIFMHDSVLKYKNSSKPRLKLKLLGTTYLPYIDVTIVCLLRNKLYIDTERVILILFCCCCWFPPQYLHLCFHVQRKPISTTSEIYFIHENITSYISGDTTIIPGRKISTVSLSMRIVLDVY